MAHSMKRNTRSRTVTEAAANDMETPPPETVDMITKAQAAQRGSNISDQTIREYCVSAHNRKAELDAARKGMQEANGRYRAVLKEAKKAGVNPDDIRWWIAARNREPSEIDAETKRRNRMARLMGLPLGSQLGLFEEDEAPVTIATQVDGDQLDGRHIRPDGIPADGRDPYQEGYDLGWAGKAYSQGPWEGPLQALHLDGWQAAQAALVGSLAPQGA